MSSGQYEAMKGMKPNKKIKVFLGGTCNNSAWRDDMIPKLKIDYFNPVVKDWNDESRKEEIRQRDECDFLLYVITPRMQGVYSVAEVIDDSNKRPSRTIFCFLEIDQGDMEEPEPNRRGTLIQATNKVYFTDTQRKSLIAVGNMIERNGAYWFKSIDDVITFLNKYQNG